MAHKFEAGAKTYCSVKPSTLLMTYMQVPLVSCVQAAQLKRSGPCPRRVRGPRRFTCPWESLSSKCAACCSMLERSGVETEAFSGCDMTGFLSKQPELRACRKKLLYCGVLKGRYKMTVAHLTFFGILLLGPNSTRHIVCQLKLPPASGGPTLVRDRTRVPSRNIHSHVIEASAQALGDRKNVGNSCAHGRSWI